MHQVTSPSVKHHQVEQLQRQIQQKGGENDSCCGDLAKLVVLVVAVALCIALFTVMSPLPALICTAILLGGTSYVWIPVHPSHSGGFSRRAVYVPSPTYAHTTLPSRGFFGSGPVAGGHTTFGGGHTSFGGGYRASAAPVGAARTSFGGGGFGGRSSVAAPMRSGGGHVAFGSARR